MRVAFVGCGYVAEFYVQTLGNHPHLQLAGVYDNDVDRLRRFSRHYGVRTYATFGALLDDPSVDIVVNLTNPRSHHEVTEASLNANKHVYSEKPLAMTPREAVHLVDLAAKRRRSLACAPCSVLGEAAQTVWQLLRHGAIGPVRLVYANLEGGMVHLVRPWERWRSQAGTVWPAKDEFEVGCTFEHAGYYLTWFAAFFGPARRVTAFASVQIRETGLPVDFISPDFSVGCIEYPHGVVVRMTNGRIAPRDYSLLIVGDRGTLSVSHAMDYGAPVHLKMYALDSSGAAPSKLATRLKRKVFARDQRGPLGVARNTAALVVSRLRRANSTRIPLVRAADFVRPIGGHAMDFCRGIADQANALEQGCVCRLTGELAVHIVEITEALQYPERSNFRRHITSAFPPIEPMPWAV